MTNNHELTKYLSKCLGKWLVYEINLPTNFATDQQIFFNVEPSTRHDLYL